MKNYVNGNENRLKEADRNSLEKITGQAYGQENSTTGNIDSLRYYGRKGFVLGLVVIIVLVAVTFLTACENKTMKQTKDTSKTVKEQVTETSANDNQRVISNEITIDEKKYTLPCRLAEFMADGWEIEDDTIYEIPENTVMHIFITKNGQDFQVAAAGQDGKASTLDDSLVYGLYIDNKIMQIPSWKYINFNTLLNKMKASAIGDELTEIQNKDFYEVYFENDSENFVYLIESDREREYIVIRFFDASHPKDGYEIGVIKK